MICVAEQPKKPEQEKALLYRVLVREALSGEAPVKEAVVKIQKQLQAEVSV